MFTNLKGFFTKELLAEVVAQVIIVVVATLAVSIVIEGTKAVGSKLVESFNEKYGKTPQEN